MKKRKQVRTPRRDFSLIKRFKQFRLHHRIFFYILGALGVIFVWRGVWMMIDRTPIFSHPVTSLAVGIGLTVFAGLFFELV